MRTTINIDDDLLERASHLMGPIDRTALVREAFKALIERESGRRSGKSSGAQHHEAGEMAALSPVDRDARTIPDTPPDTTNAMASALATSSGCTCERCTMYN